MSIRVQQGSIHRAQLLTKVTLGLPLAPESRSAVTVSSVHISSHASLMSIRIGRATACFTRSVNSSSSSLHHLQQSNFATRLCVAIHKASCVGSMCTHININAASKSTNIKLLWSIPCLRLTGHANGHCTISSSCATHTSEMRRSSTSWTNKSTSQIPISKTSTLP